MKILLIGYGKMGKTIEKVALARHHEIVGRIDHLNFTDLNNYNAQNTDVAIEFTQPEAAYHNILYCLENNIPIVAGTTGWLSQKPILEDICLKREGSFLYASNFSIGVNLFFQLNQILAQLIAPFGEYQPSLEEIHHTEKKDAPSGTAITLAEGILPHFPVKQRWVNYDTDNPEKLSIISKRLPGVAGTHSVFYHAHDDSIEIKHIAHNRNGFATGAIIAAEWIQGKKGVFSMQDVIKDLTLREST